MVKKNEFFVHLFMTLLNNLLVINRFEEKWQELQIKVVELPQAGCEERQSYSRGATFDP